MFFNSIRRGLLFALSVACVVTGSYFTSPVSAASYVLVSSDFNNSVQMYDFNGTRIKSFVAPGFGGLGSPQGICVGGDASVYVSSATSDQLLHYGNDGSFLGAINGGGLDQPWYCTFGPDQNLYVSSSLTSQVLCYDAAGNFLHVAATGGGLFRPDGLEFDHDGNMLVSDFYAPNSRIKKYNPNTGTFLGDVVVDPGLSQPLQNRLSADGQTLFVSSFGTNEIRKYDVASGAYLGNLAGTPLNGPVGQLVLPGGDLLVSSWNNSTIYKFDPLTGASHGVFTAGGNLNRPNNMAILTIVPEPTSVAICAIAFATACLSRRRKANQRGLAGALHRANNANAVGSA